MCFMKHGKRHIVDPVIKETMGRIFRGEVDVIRSALRQSTSDLKSIR